MPGYDVVVKSGAKGSRWVPGQGNSIRSLAHYATATRFADLPEDVIDHARRILLDTIGVILGGSTAPEVTALAQRLAMRDGGRCTLIGHGLKSSALHAALVNGTAATWLDYDSGHRPPPGKPLLPAAHPPVHLVPAALAAGEVVGASGADFLTALVVGYDVGARIGMGSRVRAEIHCHGTYHNIGAAACVARLKGVDEETMERVINLAIQLTLMPSFENAYQGRTVRNIYAAAGGMIGILTPSLAKSGFRAEHDALGSVYGTVISPWLDPARITEELGSRYEITQGFIKRHPMCRMGHPALEAAEALINQNTIDHEEIESVEVRTYGFAAKCNDRAPTTELGAKFSIPWGVASMLVRKSAGIADFREEALKDVRTRAVAARVTVTEDGKFTAIAQDGKMRPASVTVRTKSGLLLYSEVERNIGGPDSPLSMSQVLEKFYSLADPVIGNDRARKVARIIVELQELPSIDEVTNILMYRAF